MITDRKSLTIIRNDYCKIISVSNQKKETLQDYVLRVRNEKNLSTTDVQNNSNRKISSSYITRIENEPNKKVSPEKLQALAKGLGVPEYEILEVAGFTAPSANPVLDEALGFFSGFEELDEEDREDFKPTLVMIANEIRRKL